MALEVQLIERRPNDVAAVRILRRQACCRWEAASLKHIRNVRRL